MSLTNEPKDNTFSYCGVCGGYKGDYIPLINPSTAQPTPCSCVEQIPWTQLGWKCPNCGAGISPTTSQCPNCKPPLTVTF